MPSLTTFSEANRVPLDGTEYIRLATPGANWKAQIGGQVWIFGGLAGGNAAGSTLTLQGTIGTGTTDSIVFQTGSQVTKWTMNNGGQLLGSTGYSGFNPGSNALGQLTLGGNFGGGIVLADGAGSIGLWSTNTAATLNIGVGGTSGGITAQTTFTSTTQTGPGILVGGTGAGSTLTLESTSGAGTSDAINFRTGSQVLALQIDGSQNIIVQTQAIQNKRTIGNNSGTLDVSSQTALSVANGANAAIFGPGALMGLVIISDANGSSALYLCSAGGSTMVGANGADFVASTTTPAAGHSSVAFATQINVYNNSGGTMTYHVMVLRTG